MQEENSVSTIAPAAFVFAGAPLRVGKLITVLLALLSCHSTFAARADSCRTTRRPVALPPACTTRLTE